MSRALELTSTLADRRLVVTVRGEVDLDSSPALLESIQRALAQAPRVVVDLADVGYIDSSGLAVLVQGLRAAKRRKREFTLRRPSAKVKAVLELADLQGLFALEPDPDPAS